MNKPKIQIDKELLIELYVNQKLSLEQIGTKFNVCGTTILNYLKKQNISRYSPGEKLLHDLSWKEFGNWLVTNEYKEIKGHTRWKALCKLCNKYYWVLNRTLTHGNSQKCQFCDRLLRKIEYGEIWHSYWTTIQMHAKNRNLEFQITPQYTWELFLKQNKKCALSGIDLVMGYKKNQTASLDRIDSNQGYIEGNVQWVHKIINRVKWILNNDEFIDWCNKISKFQNKK